MIYRKHLINSAYIFYLRATYDKFKGDLKTDLKVFEMADISRWPTFTHTTQVNSRIWLCPVDDTINTVLCIIIISIIIL